MPDVSSAAYTHYSDCSYHDYPDSAISDNNPSTYVQGCHYIAIDLGIGNAQILGWIRIAVLNSAAKTAMNNSLFQGSNDSTNGSDGTWTTLHTILSSELVDSGFSNEIAVTLSIGYRFFRISGLPAGSSIVICEWELLQSQQARKCYLHARRDRMNIKGVSTQNSLA